MELNIKRESNFTIHVQLKEQIKGLILNNILVNGAQLPTVRQLGEFLRINKNTASKVYKELEEEGYVYSVKGKGTFVSHTDKPRRTREFMEIVEGMLKKGIEFGLSLEEIWGIVYSRSQYFKILEARDRSRKIAIIECNENSIGEFKKMVMSQVGELKVESVLIEEMVTDFNSVKNRTKDVEIFVVPYIHYEEVKKEISKLNKEVIVIGTNQSLKILTYGKKLKNKVVGVIGYTLEDEQAISKQFNRINAKEFIYFGGTSKEGEKLVLKEFLRKIDTLIICSTVEKIVVERLKPKKPYFVFEGKYDKDDFKILREVFS